MNGIDPGIDGEMDMEKKGTAAMNKQLRTKKWNTGTMVQSVPICKLTTVLNPALVGFSKVKQKVFILSCIFLNPLLL